MRSMTGFGKHTDSNEHFEINVEIKTVNHRYFDFHVRMPGFLNFMEMDLKKRVQSQMERGRVDLSVYLVKKDAEGRKVSVNLALAEKLKESMDFLKEELDLNSQVSLSDLLRFDDVLSIVPEEEDEDLLKDFVLSNLDLALEDLNTMREREGQNLKKDLERLLDRLEEKRQSMNERSPKLADEMEERFNKALEKLHMDLDEKDYHRVAIEVCIYREKIDIREEVVRLGSHIQQFRQKMEEEGSVGKTLDFIVQEMNREVNTISSKSNDAILTADAVEAKTIIESIREQIQNIE